MKQISFWLVLLLSLVSCREKELEVKEGLLLKFEEEELFIQDIVDKIPKGVHPADSALLFNSLVDSWVKDHVLVDFASSRLPYMDKIERKVKDYRNSLIVQEYLTRMRESQPNQNDEGKIKEYYDKHRNELILEVPLVKGIFMKINSGSSGKEEIKSLLSSHDLSSIDKLEQQWLDRALEYNYFRDKWIDWESLTSLIPYRFDDPDLFLEENQYFETEYGDCIYVLQISDYLPSGIEQPYDFASAWIARLLKQSNLMDYEETLTNSLISNSIKNHQLEIIGYDPLKHELISK